MDFTFLRFFRLITVFPGTFDWFYFLARFFPNKIYYIGFLLINPLYSFMADHHAASGGTTARMKTVVYPCRRSDLTEVVTLATKPGKPSDKRHMERRVTAPGAARLTVQAARTFNTAEANQAVANRRFKKILSNRVTAGIFDFRRSPA
ncbi:MAG: hypothetical protein QHH75_10100 [Bacillota bacterium]|nr:hypothetical protein [Bacillota bacterium]